MGINIEQDMNRAFGLCSHLYPPPPHCIFNDAASVWLYIASICNAECVTDMQKVVCGERLSRCQGCSHLLYARHP
jgi:hypothetical protein